MVVVAVLVAVLEEALEEVQVQEEKEVKNFEAPIPWSAARR